MGYTLDQSVKAFVMDHFSLEVVEIIDEVYRRLTTERDRRDAFRIFDTMEGVKTLHDNGWLITNHSSAHYPVSEAVHIDHFAEEFQECEAALKTELGEGTDFWVLPFDRKSLEIEALLRHFRDADDAARHLVLVGGRVNKDYASQQQIIYRIDPPYLDGEGLVRYLGSLRV
jgi:peptidoglycan/xylan/chitin deacetylase (PgdA/CDA1 family)